MQFGSFYLIRHNYIFLPKNVKFSIISNVKKFPFDNIRIIVKLSL
jgi:hypothetical protein